MNESIPFKLYANCIAVKGASRSSICDLQRNKTHLIPNALYEILSEMEGKTINDVKLVFENEYDDIIDEYFRFLESEDIIFYTTSPEYFPSLNLQWEYPFDINNCILDLDNTSDFDFRSIFQSLNMLGCRFMEIRSYNSFPLDFYQQIIDYAKGTTITSIALIAPFVDTVSIQNWENFCDQNNRITSLSIHSADENNHFFSNRFQVPIEITKSKITSAKCCGKISEYYFVATIDSFTESLKYNSCLNRKISIAANGEIKNCPSMANSFGNIKNTKLESVVGNAQFKKIWNVSKDKVKVCADCEFRYVCSDCRAYLEDPEDDLSKPLKCGYDPYSCSWHDWSNHPMKQDAISHYGL